MNGPVHISCLLVHLLARMAPLDAPTAVARHCGGAGAASVCRCKTHEALQGLARGRFSDGVLRRNPVTLATANHNAAGRAC